MNEFVYRTIQEDLARDVATIEREIPRLEADWDELSSEYGELKGRETQTLKARDTIEEWAKGGGSPDLADSLLGRASEKMGMIEGRLRDAGVELVQNWGKRQELHRKRDRLQAELEVMGALA